MADRYYTLTTPAKKRQADVVKGASATPANFIDLRVTYNATGASKQAVLDALEAFEYYIVNDAWPPV